MRVKRRLVGMAIVASALGSTAAMADDKTEMKDMSNEDWVLVAGGVIYGPVYSGSNKDDVFAGAAVMGRVAGFRVSPRFAGAAVDLIRDDSNSVQFMLGPVVRGRFDRTSKNLKNDVVESLGKLDTAVEVGVNTGVGFSKVLNDYDQAEVSVDFRKDIAGGHEGVVISPSVNYLTPLSRGAAAIVMLSADYWSSKTSRYYWSVSPEQSVRSGLPTYRADSGFNSVAALAMGVIDFDGNLLNGGFSAFVGGGYQRLTGSAKNTPITQIEGDADQFFAGIGIGYTFF